MHGVYKLANLVYNRFMYNLMMKLVDLTADTIKCALLTSAYVSNESHNLWPDVSGCEASGTGYAAGGTTLAGKTVIQDDTNNESVFSANNVIWTGATVTAGYAVLYDVTAANSLVCLIDFGTDKSSSGEDFSIIWHTDGIIILALKAA